LAHGAAAAHGLEFDGERAQRAGEAHANVAQAAGEALPYPHAAFDLVLSHEVLEHVADDRRSVEEIVRVLTPGGRLVLFVPNRNYPFETHGIYWGGRYLFGNFPLVNYLPDRLRQQLAPHVRAYLRPQLEALFEGLPVRVIERRILFGAYDNWIARWPRLGRALRWLLQRLEGTPLRAFGLSHLWVVEKH
jgi:SAM-dependent methyltransferase